ncbi:dynamin family protein [Undibacterium seohonense]|uniref:Dynamin family protein n=1 Tax=Undibacterium seohonense TaxID=1344950 RepID=A0ABR6WYV4_9BURK|nr:dynamin family protein [Undibacterium seohonense]MBC3805802.1 dynamin family protein [Undibacterium seohonense]
MSLTPHFVERARSSLERLSCWWRCWGRSTDVNVLSQLILEAESNLVQSIKEFGVIQGKLEALNHDFLKLNHERDALQKSFETLQISHTDLKQEHVAQSQVLNEERVASQIVQVNLKKLSQEFIILTELKDEIQQSFDRLYISHTDLKQEHEAQSLVLQNERAGFIVMQTSHIFLKDILSAQDDYLPKHQNFQRLFYDDFMAFANSENFFDREADAVLQLQAVSDEVRLLSRFPVFREKTIVAIAGGFSSGKSSLLTSFFDDKSLVRLPIGIEPVTAIPTYIVSGERSVITGFAAHGGTVAISSELYAKMGHKFVESLGFDLRRILPFVALETQWTDQLDHLCFIDTPGYNPPSIGITASDSTATVEALQQADAVLWVIALDANGEISHSDIEYLTAHLPLTPLGIVINKADLRPLTQVMEVMKQIGDTLDTLGIEYIGISAYSSVEKRELAFEKASLQEMLQIWNVPSLRKDRLIADVKQVFDSYRDAFLHEIEHRKGLATIVKDQLLDLHELGIFDEEIQESNADDTNKYETSESIENVNPIPTLGSLLKDKLDTKSPIEIKEKRSVRAQKVRQDLSQRLNDMNGRTDLLILNELLDTATHIEEAMTEVLNDEW